jgi:peroxiredoxin
MKVLTQALTLILILALTLIAGCGSDTENTAETETNGQATDSPAVAVGSTPGAQAPDFTLKNLAGGNLTLSDLRGKAVIVDFWDTWCPPCRKALPHLEELSQTYGDDLVVVGVAFGREGEAKVNAYIQEHNLTFEMVLFEETSTILSDFGGIQSIPTTFLIDANGVIVEKWVGGLDKATYEKAVVATIGDKTKTS